MNCSLLGRYPDLLSLFSDLSFSLFTDRIFGNPQIAERLRSGIQQWATWEREYRQGNIIYGHPSSIDLNLINRLEHEFRQHIPLLIMHLITHGQYTVFEEFYVAITQSFYAAESLQLAESMKNDAKGFFKHVHLRIEEEVQRSKEVLPVGSWALVREATEGAILGGRLEWLGTEGLSSGSYLPPQF